MLLEIAKLPTAENSAIHLHPTDNVAVARVPLAPGTELRIEGAALKVVDAVPAGHKVALSPIRPGEIVLRYGQVIGRAKRPIEPGQHIHTQNLAYEELELNYEFPSGEIPYPAAPAKVPTFMGYVREDGRVGTRNYIAVAVILGLGCEVNQIDHYLGPNGPRSSRLAGMTLQDSGGTLGALDRARREILGFMEKAAAEKRVEVPASKIVLGLNCGGSDSFSGITANPALGV